MVLLPIEHQFKTFYCLSVIHLKLTYSAYRNQVINVQKNRLTLSWRRSLSYKNQSIDLENQWNGFYMIGTSIMISILCEHYFARLTHFTQLVSSILPERGKGPMAWNRLRWREKFWSEASHSPWTSKINEIEKCFGNYCILLKL